MEGGTWWRYAQNFSFTTKSSDLDNLAISGLKLYTKYSKVLSENVKCEFVMCISCPKKTKKQTKPKQNTGVVLPTVFSDLVMFVPSHLPLNVGWSLFLSPYVSPAFTVSALADFRRGSCLSAILRQSRDPRVKECEPGAVTIKTFPQGQTMPDTSANAPMISDAFCVPQNTPFSS